MRAVLGGGACKTRALWPHSAPFADHVREHTSQGGGIGRRDGFKIHFPQGSRGSIPLPGTTTRMSRLLTEEALADALLVRALARMVRLEAELAALSLGPSEPGDLRDKGDSGDDGDSGDNGEPGGPACVSRALAPLAAELEDLGWVLALLTAVGQPAGAPRRAALAEVRHHPAGLALLERLAADTVGEPTGARPTVSRATRASGGAPAAAASDQKGTTPSAGRESTASPAAVWAAAVSRMVAGGPTEYEIWESERVLGPAKADRGPEPLDPTNEPAQD